MGDTKQTNLWEEIIQGLAKVLIWIFYISLGVIAKIALDSRVKLGWKAVVANTVLSVFVGVLAAVYCENSGNEKWGKIIVPVCTLIGDRIVLYFIVNWKKFASKVLPDWVFNDKKKI